jgi:hypothetical protein
MTDGINSAFKGLIAPLARYVTLNDHAYYISVLPYSAFHTRGGIVQLTISLSCYLSIYSLCSALYPYFRLHNGPENNEMIKDMEGIGRGLLKCDDVPSIIESECSLTRLGPLHL